MNNRQLLEENVGSDSPNEEFPMGPSGPILWTGIRLRSRRNNPRLAEFHSLVSSEEEQQTASSSSGQTVVNIGELSASTKEKLLGLLPLSSNCIIYKVPDVMRKSNELHTTNSFDRSNSLQLGSKHRCEGKVPCRVSPIYQGLVSSTDRLFRKPQMVKDIVYDVVLLENQLPFFILEDLFKLSKLQNIVESKSHLTFKEDTAMTVFAHEFLKDFMYPKVPERHPPSKPEHILDLYKSCLIPADWNPEKHETETTNVPSMKELYEAGVKIQVGCKENMFDIRFSDGILEIPPLHIHDFTELVFRNLLAYEICHCTKTRIFSDYFEMMRLLTLSSEETELLVQNGIIINGLPNAEGVSTLFQNISTGNIIDWSQFLYGDVIKDLNEYYNLGWHKWKATLKEKYFKAPWAICSVSVAFLLLVLAIVQSVFAILQVVVPK